MRTTHRLSSLCDIRLLQPGSCDMSVEWHPELCVFPRYPDLTILKQCFRHPLPFITEISAQLLRLKLHRLLCCVRNMYGKMENCFPTELRNCMRANDHALYLLNKPVVRNTVKHYARCNNPIVHTHQGSAMSWESHMAMACPRSGCLDHLVGGVAVDPILGAEPTRQR